MIRYEYQCIDCEDRFEVRQSIKERHRKRCYKCGGELVVLPGTGVGIIFKGSGWAKDGYSKDKK